MFSSSILLAAALVVAAPPQTGASTPTPVPKLGADGKPPLRYEQIIETTSKSGLKGRLQRTLMKQVNRVAVVALGPLPSGERRAQIIYESVRVTGNGVPPALKQVYSRFAGASLTATLNARGEITKLDGYETLVKRLSGGNALQAQRIRQTFREDALKQMFAGWFSRMPPGEIEKGAQWKNKGIFAAGPVGEIAGELTTTYQGRKQLAGRECGHFKLEAESIYVLPSGGGILGYEIVKGELKITGPRGEQFFDVRAGHLIRSNHSIRARGRVTVKVGGRQATLSVDNTDTVRVRLLSSLGSETKVTKKPAATKKRPVLRKWTSNSGKFSVNARLVEAKDGNVQLKRPDGKIITVPVAKLRSW